MTTEIKTKEVAPTEVQVGQSILFGTLPATVVGKTISSEGRVSLQLGPNLNYRSKGPVSLVIS